MFIPSKFFFLPSYYLSSQLQIRGSIEDNLKFFFFLISQQKRYVVIPHQNRLSEMVLMMSHIICLYEVTWKIIPKLSLFPPPPRTLLIWSPVPSPVSVLCDYTTTSTTCIALSILLALWKNYQCVVSSSQ